MGILYLGLLFQSDESSCPYFAPFNPSLGESPTPSSEDREFVLWDVVFQVESAGSRREFAFIELAWSD